MATLLPVWLSIPMPIIATAYNTYIATARHAEDVVFAKQHDRHEKLITMTISAHTLDSIPTDRPERMVVAGPVSVDSTISLTGGFLVEVK